MQPVVVVVVVVVANCTTAESAQKKLKTIELNRRYIVKVCVEISE